MISMAAATPPVICWNCSSWAWLVKSAKSFGWFGRRPRRARRMAVSSSMRACTSSARLGTVAMWMVSPPPFFTWGNCSSKVVMGMATKLLLVPNIPPLCSKMPITR